MTLRFITIKLLKTNDKEKILKIARGKKVRYTLREKGKDDFIFLVENNASEKIMEQYLENTKKKNSYQPKILYPIKISVKNEYVIKMFSDLQRLKELISTTSHTINVKGCPSF